MLDADRSFADAQPHQVSTTLGKMINQTLKKFKNQFHLAKSAAKQISNDNFSLKMKFDKDKGFSNSFEIPPEKRISRFVACVQPFADPESTLYFKKIWGLIIESNVEGLDIDKDVIDVEFEKIEKGPIAINIDIGKFNALDLYLVYSKGEFFNEKKEQKKIIQEFKKNPIISQILLYQFYDYSYVVYNACAYLYVLIRQIEKLKVSIEQVDSDEKNDFCCIYCLTKQGNFTSYEHVFPEAFGNKELILPPGNVCDRCNNEILSQLDSNLVNHDIFSFLRVLFVNYNPKTGKFPEAKFQNLKIEKTQPRKLVFNEQRRNKDSFIVEKQKNGTVNVKFNMVGRVPFDPIILSRSLYKIALGLVCLQFGNEVALSEKFNDSRDFIMGREKYFCNNLFISTNCIPDPSVGAHISLLNPGCIVIFKIFGITLIINLENAPIIEMNEMLRSAFFQCFPLSKLAD